MILEEMNLFGLANVLSVHKEYLFYNFFFFTYSQPGPSFNLFVQNSLSYLPPLRPLCGEAPGRDSNLGRADLVAGSLTSNHKTTTPPWTTTPPFTKLSSYRKNVFFLLTDW